MVTETSPLGRQVASTDWMVGVDADAGAAVSSNAAQAASTASSAFQLLPVARLGVVIDFSPVPPSMCTFPI